jgi:hypothetical protein
MAENARLQQLALRGELRIASSSLGAAWPSKNPFGIWPETVNWRRAPNLVDLCLEIMQRLDMTFFKHSQQVTRLSSASPKWDTGDTLDKIELPPPLRHRPLGTAHGLSQPARPRPAQDPKQGPAPGHPGFPPTRHFSPSQFSTSSIPPRIYDGG